MSNIFDQNPGAPAQPAQPAPAVQPAPQPAPAVQPAPQPAPADKRSSKLLLVGIVAVVVVAWILLGAMGLWVLPTDSVAHRFGEEIVSTVNNSETSLGYALALLMVASATVGAMFARWGK